MSKLLATSFLTISLTALAQPTIPAAQEQPRWFVLRDQQIGTCWAALLIKVDGTYRHGFARPAGGPYDTEAQALERWKALQETGTCQQ